MGRGASGLSGGGGGGNAAVRGNNNPLMQTYLDALNSPRRWTSEQRADLLATIRNTTDVGDSITWTGNTGTKRTWTKTGRDKWSDPDAISAGLGAFSSKELRDTLLVLTNGKFAFRSK